MWKPCVWFPEWPAGPWLMPPGDHAPRFQRAPTRETCSVLHKKCKCRWFGESVPGVYFPVSSMRHLGLTELWASYPQAARLGGLPGGGSCLKGDWVKSFLKSVLLSTRSVRHPWLALCGKRPGALFFFLFLVCSRAGGRGNHLSCGRSGAIKAGTAAH